MVANKRPNGLLEGAKGMEAVLDIGFPFLEGRPTAASSSEKEIMYTRCHGQQICLHSSIFDIASQYRSIGNPYR